MVKRFFKWTFRIFLALSFLLAISYGVFHLWEYGTGAKYVKYLSENSETVAIDQNFSYKLMESDIKNSKLILAGEIHGFDQPQKFDVDFFKYLHKNHNVNHYLAELDFVQANFMNDFLESGDEELLRSALKKWAVVQGRNNQDYFDKYLELHAYHKQLPENNKFEFIGIDKLQDDPLLSIYLKRFSLDTELENSSSIKDESLLKKIEVLKAHYSQSPDTLFILSHLETNVKYVQDKLGREEGLFQNFRSLYKHYNLEETRIYGYFGLYHVFQYRVNEQHPLASKIRLSDLNLENKIVSINFMMNDSYMVMPSNQLPEFMRDGTNYTRLPVTSDNMLIMYIYGVKDFKRITPLKNKSLIKMNGDDSPYSNSSRLNTTIQLLPVTDVFKMTDKGKPYVQYTVFVRNSDWAEPMKE
jgi:uncharacterized iron-regulated protein